MDHATNPRRAAQPGETRKPRAMRQLLALLSRARCAMRTDMTLRERYPVTPECPDRPIGQVAMRIEHCALCIVWCGAHGAARPRGEVCLKGSRAGRAPHGGLWIVQKQRPCQPRWDGMARQLSAYDYEEMACDCEEISSCCHHRRSPWMVGL